MVTPAPSPAALVDSFARGDSRFESYQALVSLGHEALPAIRDGLRHGNWQIRRWSAICLDRVADEQSFAGLVPLTRDPKSQVRLWAVHAIACDHCKDDARCPIDVVPLLIERIETDDNLRVRRMAVVMLGTEFTDPRAEAVFERVLRDETDRKLRLHATNGLDRLRAALARARTDH